MPVYVDSRTVLSTCRSFLDEGMTITPVFNVLQEGLVYRLYHGPIFGGCNALDGVLWAAKQKIHYLGTYTMA